MFLKKLLGLVAVLALSSCVETVVIGTVAGGVIVTQEKSFAETKDDFLIKNKLYAKFLVNGLKKPGNYIDVNVSEGRVLLTGIIRDKKTAGLASDLAWKVNGVKEVIDETELSENGLRLRDFTNNINDYTLTAQVEMKLLFAKDIASVNYELTTIDGVVYMIGIAGDESELRRALTIASKVRGVKKIVNHIILVDDSRRR